MKANQGFELHQTQHRTSPKSGEFIAKDNVDAAGRVREEILEAIRRLVAFPQQGHKRPDITKEPLRFQTMRSYLIAYAPKEKPLFVLAVFHGRRNPRIIAAILRVRK
jgi:plasmid stabilization system protein ParE